MDKTTDKQGVWVGSVALVLIVAVVAGGYWILRGGQKQAALPVNTAYETPETVEVNYVKRAGAHTFFGTIPMTSTCNRVASGVAAEEIDGVLEVRISLGVLEAQDGNCQGVADGSTQSFELAFTPEHDLPIKFVGLTVNGKAVAHTLK